MDENFQDYAVAFLDIFGFTNFIKKAELPSEQGELANLTALLEVIDKAIVVHTPEGTKIDGSFFPGDVKLECIFISDSIILSAPTHTEPDDYNGLVAVSIKTIQIAHQLMKMGFLLSGGLSIGKVYRYKNKSGSIRNIFGSGYMDAYKTQDELAINPRVVLHKSAVECIRNRPAMNSLSIFMKDGDQWILDLLNPHPTYVKQVISNTELFNIYRERIIFSLGTLPFGSSQRNKWKWMASFFNSAISFYGYGFTIRDVEPIDMGNKIHLPFKRGSVSNDDKDWMESFKRPPISGFIVCPPNG